MINSSQISERLAMYLNGHIDLDSFEDWIVANTWNIHLNNDPNAARIAYAIEESFAEYSSAHISEAQLREEFRSLMMKPEPNPVMEFVLGFPEEKISHKVRPSLNGSVIFIEEPGSARWGALDWGHQVLV